MKDKVVKFIYSRYFISFCLTFMISFMLKLQGIILYFNPISFLIVISIFVLISKVKLYVKDNFKMSIILSFVFSSMIIYGSQCYDYIITRNGGPIFGFLSFKSILSVTGLMLFIYVLLTNLFFKMTKLKMLDTSRKKRLNSKRIYIISFLVIFICWIPYFLSLFPGELSVDSVAELSMITSASEITNHHPLIHVLFIAIPYKLGYLLSNNANIAVAFSSVTQMICMSSIFSYFNTFLYKRKVKNVFIFLSICFFAIVPIHAFYSVTMWKDIMFSGLVLVLIIKVMELYGKKDDAKISELLLFSLITLLMLLFRNNAIYMFFIFFIFSIFMLKRNKKKILTCLLSVIIVYYLIMFPLFNVLGVKRSSSSEYIAMPLQQIGFMVSANVKLNKTERSMIDKLIKIDKLKELYEPRSVDYIKFSEYYHRNVFDNNKVEYLKLWGTLVLKHPVKAFEAYSLSTLGYWYPGVDNWVVCNGVVDNILGVYRVEKAPKIITNVVNKMDSKAVPFFGAFWSTSLAFYIIVMSIVFCIKKNGLNSIITYIPVLGVWLTMMIAAPVYAEFRYIYCLYTCLPFLIIYPYIYNKAS